MVVSSKILRVVYRKGLRTEFTRADFLNLTEETEAQRCEGLLSISMYSLGDLLVYDWSTAFHSVCVLKCVHACSDQPYLHIPVSSSRQDTLISP